MTCPFDRFQQIWLCDFEFCQPDGERPEPLCMVAREYRSGQLIRLWREEVLALSSPPFSIGRKAVFVAYYASAELGCFLALEWPKPVRILDLCAEFRCLTSGLSVPCGRSLLGALTYFGLEAIDVAEKDSMRELAQRGGPYTDAERRALLDYCQSDVDALARLLRAMLPTIDLPRSLFRGRYMSAVARMEWNGIPIDVPTLTRICSNWATIQSRLVAEVNREYGVYVPIGRRLNPDSTFGRAILEEAEHSHIDPYILRDAAQLVWTQQRQAKAEQAEALRTARKDTGLTAQRIRHWENSGRDLSTYPHLDTIARELASEWPSLGIGPGYRSDDGYDDTDYTRQLWDLLREGAPPLKPRHDPGILSLASDLVVQGGYREWPGPWQFSTKQFAKWLAQNGIPWPCLESGALDLTDDTFRQMARAYPAVAPLRELRYTLAQLRLSDLSVGHDGRNRCMLSAFASKTSRNQPSNSRFIFGPSVWLRGVIQPEPGMALAYVDWEQQEFGIAAALSSDEAMLDAYRSGDPYLTFAKQAGAVPQEATKQSHGDTRELFKSCALAVQYGMGAASLAQRIGQPEAYARELLRLHRETYPVFWRWSNAAVDHAMLHGWLQTVFGWRVNVGPTTNARSLRNFPMQANGAEMLRLACCLATEGGIQVCAPVHDALLIESPIEEIDQIICRCQEMMAEASGIVLNGFQLRSDSKVVRHPARYEDARGERMWSTVTKILAELPDSDSEWL